MNGTPLLESEGSAKLTACILSTYDLPYRDPPTSIKLSVGSRSVKTGPPSQRHKDRNSFKFPRENLELAAPSLPLLYGNKLLIEVLYANKTPLKAEYELKQLQIHETVWLILQLEGHPKEADEVPPTLRLQLTLSGPYRPEVDFVVKFMQHWFGFVDSTQGKLTKTTKSLPDPKFLLIPLAPLLALLVVSLPVVLGILTVTLPVALPALVVGGGVVGAALLAGSAVYGSTATGRQQVAGLLTPIFQTMVSTKVGQALVYETGPRPTPVKLTKAVVPGGLWQKLLLSILVDGIGSASYLLPVVGEVTDVAWAPIQTTLVMAMYDDPQRYATLLQYVSLVEELLPFTDIVPTASLGWFLQDGLPTLLGDRAGVAEQIHSAILAARPSPTNIDTASTHNMQPIFHQVSTDRLAV